MAAPACQNHQPHLVAEVIETLRCAPEAFQAHGVHIHVADILQLQAVGFWCVAQINVISPSGTAQQNLFAIQHKAAIPLVSQVTVCLADAKADVLAVRHLFVLNELDMKVAELRLAHVMAPPQTGVFDMNL